jgi:hypothetical protein
MDEKVSATFLGGIACTVKRRSFEVNKHNPVSALPGGKERKGYKPAKRISLFALKASPAHELLAEFLAAFGG